VRTEVKRTILAGLALSFAGLGHARAAALDVKEVEARYSKTYRSAKRSCRPCV
jgi:hypothetical protein